MAELSIVIEDAVTSALSKFFANEAEREEAEEARHETTVDAGMRAMKNKISSDFFKGHTGV
jgi:hypothetical protein